MGGDSRDGDLGPDEPAVRGAGLPPPQLLLLAAALVLVAVSGISALEAARDLHALLAAARAAWAS